VLFRSEKTKKKGELIKILNAHSKRSYKLVEILNESDSLNSRNNRVTDDEFLKKYNQMPKGGPTHSIAVNRAHHLTNFLNEYLINAFQSGHFQVPEFHDSNQTLDSNGYFKDKYSFEISNVQLPTDLTKLKIYWLASGVEEIDLEIEKYLDKSLKSQIRSTLTNQRVMNYVPEVEFIRDNTKVLMDKLDEFLLKIKLEQNFDEQSTTEEPNAAAATKKKEEPTPKMNNLFGVDFNRLVDTIKKNSDYTPWSENEQQSVELTTTTQTNDLKPIDKTTQFAVNLKAFQINQRMKRQHLNKTTILKLDTIAYHESLQNNNS